jgi:DNA-binding transcriptional MerR regulator
MLKIGEFSLLSQVTVKTLRHYDDLGLLRPAYTDPETDYRYYSLDQLPRIHRIIPLKEIGLSLEQIGVMLDDALTPQQLRGMLHLKQAELQQLVREGQKRLSRVEFRLRHIELGNAPAGLDIVVKRIEPIPALTFRGVYPSYGAMGHVTTAILAAIDGHSVKLAGPPIGISYGDEFKNDNVDHECVIPVDETRHEDLPLGKLGVCTFRCVPEMEMAATHIHQGSYESLTDKVIFFQRWVAENNLELGGAVRFVFYRGPMNHDDPDTYLTEIQHQVQRKAPHLSSPDGEREGQAVEAAV